MAPCDSHQLIAELRARIAQQDMTIAGQINRERDWAARISQLEFENQRLREAIKDSLECNDNGRHCNVCSTNMRSAIDAGRSVK